MYCPRCGKLLSDNINCPSCGVSSKNEPPDQSVNRLANSIDIPRQTVPISNHQEKPNNKVIADKTDKPTIQATPESKIYAKLRLQRFFNRYKMYPEEYHRLDGVKGWFIIILIKVMWSAFLTLSASIIMMSAYLQSSSIGLLITSLLAYLVITGHIATFVLALNKKRLFRLFYILFTLASILLYAFLPIPNAGVPLIVSYLLDEIPFVIYLFVSKRVDVTYRIFRKTNVQGYQIAMDYLHNNKDAGLLEAE